MLHFRHTWSTTEALWWMPINLISESYAESRRDAWMLIAYQRLPTATHTVLTTLTLCRFFSHLKTTFRLIGYRSRLHIFHVKVLPRACHGTLPQNHLLNHLLLPSPGFQLRRKLMHVIMTGRILKAIFQSQMTWQKWRNSLPWQPFPLHLWKPPVCHLEFWRSKLKRLLGNTFTLIILL